MTQITTVAELNALPVGAVVMNSGGWTYKKILNNRFLQMADEFPVYADHVLKAAPSVSVAYLPTVATPSPLHMTRCTGSDSCTTTTPLPVGASWCCPDCGGTNNTTGGN